MNGLTIKAVDIQMNKKQALRMGFAPYQPDLFKEPCPRAEWSRVLQRPRCTEYWNPAKPGKIRRVLVQKAPDLEPEIKWRKA